jgi:hypothetical protein
LRRSLTPPVGNSLGMHPHGSASGIFGQKGKISDVQPWFYLNITNIVLY